MTDESFGPMSDDEARQFASKLGELSAGLTAKERWFLSEVLARGVESGRVDSEVEGYSPGSTIFFPAGMGPTYSVSTLPTNAAHLMKIKAP